MPPVHPFPDRIATARFQLRRFHASQMHAMLQLIDRNRERLLRNFPELANGVTTGDEASAYMIRCRSAAGR